MFWRRNQEPADYMIVIAKHFCNDCSFRQIPFKGTRDEARKKAIEICYEGYGSKRFDHYNFTVVELTKDNKEQEGDE